MSTNILGKSLWKNPNEIFGQPNISAACYFPQKLSSDLGYYHQYLLHLPFTTQKRHAFRSLRKEQNIQFRIRGGQTYPVGRNQHSPTSQSTINTII